MSAKQLAPEIYSISVVLQPLAEAVIPLAHGYHAYAFFLNLMGRSSPSVAEALHSSDQAKPFTLSPLEGKFGRAKRGFLKIFPLSRYSMRLTFLQGDLFARFLDGALKWGNKTIELGPAVCHAVEVNTMGSPACNFHSYQGLLEQAYAERKIELEFTSPTAFRSGGKRNVVFPEPQLVFGSYLAKWQAFSPIKMDTDLSPWLEKTIVARHKLETRILSFGSYQEVGFTGKCQFELSQDTPEEVVIALNALADFAFYCGTGAKTTMGMGQTSIKKVASEVASKSNASGGKETNPRKGIEITH